MTCAELIDMLEMFEPSAKVMISRDGVSCTDVVGVDFVQNVRKDEEHKTFKIEEFVSIMAKR